MGDWYRSENNWEENERSALEIFKKIKAELESHQKKDLQPGENPPPVKFLDEDFSTDKCWYAGGTADEVNEMNSGPAGWVRLSDMQGTINVWSMKSYGRVTQGVVTNGYFVEAMQALGMRQEMVKKLFVAYDVALGLYIVRLFKNGQWVSVVIDDYMPLGNNSEPLCSRNANFPSTCWASLLEKAYAKLHHSYEAIGDGGSVVQAMVDLTGGIGGRFSVRDVASDRLFVYLHELQCEALFAARPDGRECARRGVRLVDAPYALNRCAHHEGRCWVQLVCPALCGGPFDDVVPYSLMHHPDHPESVTDGCFWLSVEDFQTYFAIIFECRMVQAKSLEEMSLAQGMPEIRLLGSRRPLFDTMYAHVETIRSETVPEFKISVKDGQAPCEIYVCCSQIDLRMRTQERTPQVPMLVTAHEYVPGKLNGWAFVAKSSYEPERDAGLVFKALRPGDYLILLQIPMGSEFTKMIFRCYATSDVLVEVNSRQFKHTRIIVPTEDLCSVPLSLVGRGDDGSHPKVFDPEEGLGSKHGEPKEQDAGGCSVM